MTSAGASKAASAWSAVQSLGDWFVIALLCLSTALAVGLLSAAPLGTAVIQMSLVGAL
jgi:hypothetical protein